MTQAESTVQKKPAGGGKKILLVLLAVVVVFVGYRIFFSGGDEDVQEEEKAAVNVQVVTVDRANIQVETPLSGKIEPKDQVLVPAMLQTEITGVYVEVGDYVNAGATLFTQDSVQIQGSYQQASAAVNIAQESLSSAKLNYDRMTVLYQEGAVSQQAYEQAQTQYNTAQQQLSQAQATLSTASDAMKNATATAPISGYVTEVNVIRGAYPSSQYAVAIANTNDLEINTSVSEYLIGRIREGQKVNVAVKSLSDDLYQGTITSVAPAPSTGTLTYPITVKIDDNQAGIVAGMFAEVQIVSDSRENVLAIPSDAVLIRSGETQVVVLDSENRPSYATVETGLDNGSLVEIVSGLKEGDVVVSVGQNYVVVGEPVIIQNGENNAGDSGESAER